MPSDKKSYMKLLGHLGAILVMVAWGSSFICTKVLMLDGGFTPVECYTYRFAAAYLILLLFTFKKIRSNNWHDELMFLVCGVCAGSLYFILENYALKYTTTANVSLLASISPIFTTLLVAFFFKVRIGAGTAIGSLVAAAGVACVVFSHGEGLEIHPKGDIIALCAAVSWAVYSIVAKQLIPHYDSFFMSRKIFFYGVLTSLPLLIFQQEPLHVGALWDFAHPQVLMNFLFLVLFCSLAAYIVWNEAMKILGPITSNNYLYLQPLVTMVVGYIVLGEKIFMLGYIGCVLIIGGLVIADKLKLK